VVNHRLQNYKIVILPALGCFSQFNPDIVGTQRSVALFNLLSQHSKLAEFVNPAPILPQKYYKYKVKSLR
jgi:hypothetical protein